MKVRPFTADLDQIALMNSPVSDARIQELILILAGGSPSDDDCVDAACALKTLINIREAAFALAEEVGAIIALDNDASLQAKIANLTAWCDQVTMDLKLACKLETQASNARPMTLTDERLRLLLAEFEDAVRYSDRNPQDGYAKDEVMIARRIVVDAVFSEETKQNAPGVVS